MHLMSGDSHTAQHILLGNLVLPHQLAMQPLLREWHNLNQSS